MGSGSTDNITPGRRRIQPLGGLLAHRVETRTLLG